MIDTAVCPITNKGSTREKHRSKTTDAFAFSDANNTDDDEIISINILTEKA